MAKQLFFISFFIFYLITTCLSQNVGKNIPFRMNFHMSVSVPHGVSNKAFRSSFTGIYDIAMNVNAKVFKGFMAGIQFRTNDWKTADNKIPGINTHAKAHNGGLRISYEFVRSEQSTAFVGITAERSMIKYSGLSINSGTDLMLLKDKDFYNSVVLDAGMFFYTEGNFAIGFNLATVLTNYNFDPYALYLNQHHAYIASDLNGTWTHFNLGFNLVYSFLNKIGKT